MDGFIVSVVDHETTLAFSHSLRPPQSRHLNRQNEGPRKQTFLSALPRGGPAPHGNFPSALEELRLGQNSFPMTAKSKQKRLGCGRGKGSAPDDAGCPSSCAGTQGRDQAHRLGETLYAPRNHRHVCVCVCVCVCARARVASGGWGAGSSSEPPARKTLRDYLVQPPHFRGQVAGGPERERNLFTVTGNSVTQAPRAGFSVGQ